jgi:glutamate-ammonia-ligase adenylyltransferase
MISNGKIPAELSHEASDRWHEFCRALERAHLALPDDVISPDTIKRGFAFSDFVARSCVQAPGMSLDLITSGDLQRSYLPGEYDTHVAEKIKGVTAHQALGQALGDVRRREMVRIAWRDLAGSADLMETMADLSAFAEACLDKTLARLYEQQCRKNGTPYDNDGVRQYLVVIALGKLGGRELNFSSDVDLVFAYPRAGQTRGTVSSMSNEDFFLNLCRTFISVAGSATAAGPLFRIDMRLRPYGDSGPLVMNFDAMERYYQYQGREWERYAWIKARIVAGDKIAGERLLTRMKPFVFRRYLDFGAFDSLRELKARINLEVRRKGLENNIKTGRGGIREIEFFGQMFQLLRGGVKPVLQEPGLLNVIETLFKENHIRQPVYEALTHAYVFLRNTEHRLQENYDRPIHTLPEIAVEQLRLAAAMGFDHWNGFESCINKHRDRVHGYFKALFETDDAPGATRQKPEIRQQLEGVWLGLLPPEQACHVLELAGLDEFEKIVPLLADFRQHPHTRALSENGRRRLDRLIPRILEAVIAQNLPAATVNRILDLLKTIERRTCYLALLNENPESLRHLVRLVNASFWIASFVAMHPAILDELIDPRTLYGAIEKKDLETELRHRMKRVGAGDLESQMELLCNFKQGNVLRVAAADVTGALPLMKVSDRLTDIAETVIDKTLALAWAHLAEKHGVPVCRLNGVPCDRGFAVIAYGKLGGLELGYGSDLDLVFLHSGIAGLTEGNGKNIENARFFARLGQRVIHFLTVPTPAGHLYEIDMRLRPSGSSGLLVSHIDVFGAYQRNKAWTWEQQALIKARPICGDIALAAWFTRLRKEIITRPRNGKALGKEVTTMRDRMRHEHGAGGQNGFDLKQGAGGMVDIEFLVQLLVLQNAHQYPTLTDWTDTVRLLDTLARCHVMDKKTTLFLKETYLAYRSAVHRYSLQEKPALVPGKKFDGHRKKVASIWHFFLG